VFPVRYGLYLCVPYGSHTDQPTRSRFSVVFLGPRANAELVLKFHVALHASHAALQILTFPNFSP
jgi:hypothetical protein